MPNYRIEIAPGSSVYESSTLYLVHDEDTGAQLPSVNVISGGEYASPIAEGTGLEIYGEPVYPVVPIYEFTVRPPLRTQAEVIDAIAKFSTFVAGFRSPDSTK